MTGTPSPDEAQQRLDALRRRLYRSDATEEDLRRYAAERDASTPPGRQVAAVVVPARSTRLLLPAAVVLVLVAAVAGIALSTPTTAAPPLVRADPSRTVIDEGTTLSATPSGSVVREPRSRTTAPDGTARVAQRFHGVGAAVVPLDLTTASFADGRAVVTLTTSRPGPIAWRAIRRHTRQDWSSYPEVVARSPATDGAGTAASTVTPYRGAPPGWIAVDADHDGRWTLVVVFLSPAPAHPDCTHPRSCRAG